MQKFTKTRGSIRLPQSNQCLDKTNQNSLDIGTMKWSKLLILILFSQTKRFIVILIVNEIIFFFLSAIK